MILINPASTLRNDLCFLYLHPPHLVLNVINHSSISTQLISHMNTNLISFKITSLAVLIIMLLISSKDLCVLYTSIISIICCCC